MMIKTSAIAVTALLVASAAYANCERNDEVLFSCLTANGKYIEVCNFGKTVQYSYGRPSTKPEIVVVVPREKVDGTLSSGIGRYISYAVAIPNGNTIYQVSWFADKLQESNKLEGSVEVITNDKSKFISCQSEPLIGNTEGIHFEEVSGR